MPSRAVLTIMDTYEEYVEDCFDRGVTPIGANDWERAKREAREVVQREFGQE